jgi:hypothetical protein
MASKSSSTSSSTMAYKLDVILNILTITYFHMEVLYGYYSLLKTSHNPLMIKLIELEIKETLDK